MQINFAQSSISSLQSRVDALSSNFSGETIRASRSEASLGMSVLVETMRASFAESSLAVRSITLENSIATLSTTLAQTQSTVVQSQSTIVQLQSSLQAAVSNDAAALATVVRQLNAITNCTARGMLPDGSGNCLPISGASTNGASGSTTCGAANGTQQPACMPGFAPSTSSTPACAGGTALPTTFTCAGMVVIFTSNFPPVFRSLTTSGSVSHQQQWHQCTERLFVQRGLLRCHSRLHCRPLFRWCVLSCAVPCEQQRARYTSRVRVQRWVQWHYHRKYRLSFLQWCVLCSPLSHQ
jgi:hypothetical protein